MDARNKLYHLLEKTASSAYEYVAMGQMRSKSSHDGGGQDNEDTFSDLPPPPRPSKTIQLCPKLKPNHERSQRNEMSFRACIHTFSKPHENQRMNDANVRDHVKTKTPVLGSDDRTVISDGNHGFFSTVRQAYDNHYALRTCPEDWWCTIIRKVAVAIDNNAKSETVRDFFVSHEEKKTLTVRVGPDIYGVDYAWFLDQMTQQISDNLKIPEYVGLLKADFSTSTPAHVIVSEITVMASVQEYFDYEMMTLCGIPALEMEGGEEDWARLEEKVVQLESLLEPIRDAIGLSSTWWKGVKEICGKLLRTFQGKPDTRWWSHIYSMKFPFGSGACTYDGWFISKLLGLGSLENLGELNNGVVTVPMNITDGVTGLKEESAFAGGIAGFEMFKGEGSGWPSVQAVHGWVLMLEPDSKLRKDLAKWEAKLGKGA